MKGVPRHGNKSLDYFRVWDIQINPSRPNGFDQDGNEIIEPTNKSYILLRMHDSKAKANLTDEECISQFKGFHVREFEYNGIDKNENQLIAWLFSSGEMKPTSGENIDIGNAKEEK